MFPIRKRTLAITALVGALAYGSQHYTLTGWQHIRVKKVGDEKATPEAVEMGWRSSNPVPWTPNASSTESTAGHEAGRNATASNAANSWASWSALVSKTSTSAPSNPQAARGEDPRIRIATFNLHSFGESKLQKQPVVETLARIIRQFDVVALQHIHSRQTDILPMLLDRINMSDRRYDYCIGPRVGPENAKQQFAFVFDTARIETDREQLYTVEDPQNLMDYEPLVGWFRVKRLHPEASFTFSLVNVRIDPASADRERDLLPALLRSVRQDGRAEDDVILLGDFSSSSTQIQSVPTLGLHTAIDEVATTVSGEWMLDNILFPTRSTDEFTGRSGVIDFLRQLNLSYDQAMQVSAHLPVWAEFSAFEGGVAR
ncbi:MAG: endonuclease/exonuclease/phosphatase family protein [Pirellula sp.]|jgi:endonuclease/exonuclease/phosphatase family metal-dependent hydrolase|nr:endonuclease/exonuclease/phosphatase family protein [Pirellula sp.]